ncbi:MAG: LTA synthase family protein [Lachnospiraceae bacterium]|nr:LTA synthase family protein [Lachnospiraceae bacterium]
MKSHKRLIIFIVADIILAVLSCAASVYFMKLRDNMVMNVYFGESHAGQSNIAQLYYAENDKEFSNNQVYTEVFADTPFTFDISEIDFDKDIIRFDPFNLKRDFSIEKIEVCYGKHVVLSIAGKDIKKYGKAKGMKSKVEGELLVCRSKKNNPNIVFKRSFSDKLARYNYLIGKMPYIVMALAALLLGFIQIVLLKGGEKKHWIMFIISQLILIASATFTYAINYFEGHFGQVPFGQLVYHLHTPLDGTDISSYRDVIEVGVLLVVALVVVNSFIYTFLKKKQAHYGYLTWVITVTVVVLASSLYRGIIHYNVIEYYQYTHESTMLYEDYYVDGRDVSITAPKDKRNLIYIFLESMETSFSDNQSGGGMQEDLIPNLTKLALENECFSDGTVLNGAHHVPGATYTMGALAAQTSGAPINEAIVSNETLNGNWESENNYLPGVWAIGDVLQKQGYNQEFLIGSDGGFAGRSSYFKGHGNYAVEDYDAAIKEQRIPEDYKVWWGYEDEKLYQLAKEDIKKLAKSGEPFNFTMLTVDTHFTDGYKCRLCDDKYDSQYSNVIACADGQVAEFIEWVKAQDFYENTTIVICGDHLTPDSFYVNAQGIGGIDRRTYTAIINPAEGKKYTGEGRVYTTLDMYPTTLSAMGYTIEGSRLGLGVDLFSDVPTIAEEKGLDYLNLELYKNSSYYTKQLLYK